MKFISVEQFLKQDKEVQNVFIDWWKPEIADLFQYNYGNSSIEIINLKSIKEDVKESKYSAHIIPLLTEGQLREFIEDNTGSTFTEITYFEHENGQYDIYTENVFFENLGNDLLQAYWKVAVYIAKENIKH